MANHQLAELFSLPRSHNNRKHFSSQSSGELEVEVREVFGDPIRTSRRRARFQNVEPIISTTSSGTYVLHSFELPQFQILQNDVIVRNQFSTENGVNKEHFVSG